MLNKIVVTIYLLLLGCGCASKSALPSITNEKFNTHISHKGKTEFTYDLSWKNTSRSRSQRGDRTDATQYQDPRNFTSQNTEVFAIQANNQTKMELEDKAAVSLQKKLLGENICPNGYDITDVIWQANNIQLLGYCFD